MTLENTMSGLVWVWSEHSSICSSTGKVRACKGFGCISISKGESFRPFQYAAMRIRAQGREVRKLKPSAYLGIRPAFMLVVAYASNPLPSWVVGRINVKKWAQRYVVLSQAPGYTRYLKDGRNARTLGVFFKCYKVFLDLAVSR